MICYKCGCTLSEHNFCTACGADVSLYKKIMHISNQFYNEGLERAGVRDLSGAVESLRQSLKFNKNNVDARNLLGLVYFEMGEVVAALSEWVISKNLRPKKNVADDYLEMIQANTGRLDTINQTIKKYNQALAYCQQEGYDLAVIQLKKVISLNPKFIRARQLLALLYINSEEWEKAKRELDKCNDIDKNNTTTLRYLKEVEDMLMPEDGTARPQRGRKNSQPEIVKYQSGNETIIQPVNVKENRGMSSLLNLGIGLAVGIAIAVFLILPARIQAAKEGIDTELRTVSEQSDAKSATIDELQQQLADLQEQRDTLSQDLDAYMGTDGSLRSMDAIMRAANIYLTDPSNITEVADNLEEIEPEIEGQESDKSEAFTDLQTTLTALIGSSASQSFYEAGSAAFKAENYEDAIPNLEKAFQYDATNGDALYTLGTAYYKSGDLEKAAEMFTQVIELFPGTERAAKAESYLGEINDTQ